MKNFKQLNVIDLNNFKSIKKKPESITYKNNRTVLIYSSMISNYKYKKLNYNATIINNIRYYSNIITSNDNDNFLDSINKYEPDKKIDSKSVGFKKEKIKHLFLNPDNLNLLDFISDFQDMKFKLNLNFKYAYLIKIKLVSNIYRNAGHHGIWSSGNLDDLYDQIIAKLEDFIDDYSDDEIELIDIMFIELDELPKLKLKNINKLDINKKLIKKVETKKYFSENYLPLTTNLNYYGLPLEYKLNTEGYITDIIFENKNIFSNIILDKNHSNTKGGSKLILDPITDKSKLNIFHYTRNFNSKLTNKKRHRNFILIVKDIGENRIIEVFELNLNSNIFVRSQKKNIANVQDKTSELISGDRFVCDNNFRFGNPKFVAYDKPGQDSLGNENKTIFKRKINNFSLVIENDKVIKYENNLTLPNISYTDLSINKHTRNSNIGVLDIETYFNSGEDKSYTFALGYKIFKGETKLFYIKENQTSNELIIECINEMLVNKYNNYTFYVHNLHGYDSVFILNALIEYNSKNNDYYNIKLIFRDSRIIKLSVSIKVGKSTKKITFVDSYLMLPASLDKLAKDFECKYTKGDFPYE
jgi:hypothetical protein